MIFDGACPFLTCLDTEWHAHPACPDCGAVRYGNAFCATCVKTWDVSAESKSALLAAIDARAEES